MINISEKEQCQIMDAAKFLLSILESYVLSKRLGTRQTLILEARLRIRELYDTPLRYADKMKDNLDCLTRLFDIFKGDTDEIEKGILYCNTIFEYLDILTFQRNC